MATALAKRLGGEIISCDSVQVYRGFNIGSAKPSLEEQRAIPYHCIDIRDWNDPFDAQQFRKVAGQAIIDTQSKGKLPILCGGSGLYLRVLRWGLADGPGADDALRKRLEQEEKLEPGLLVSRLIAADPQAGDSVDLQNPRRVIRALEILELSGKTPTQLRQEHGFREEEVPMSVFCLDWSNDNLRERLHRRLEQMLELGWVDEVRTLLAAGVSKECMPMTAVGYRNIVESLDAPIGESELFLGILKSTWAYARRQRTWMRKEKDVQMISREEYGDLDGVLEFIEEKIRE